MSTDKDDGKERKCSKVDSVLELKSLKMQDAISKVLIRFSN